MLDRHARARQHQTPDALGNLHGESGADAHPGARRQPGGLGRVEVEAGVVVVCPRGQRRLHVELHEPQLAGALTRQFVLGDGHRHATASRLSLRRVGRYGIAARAR